MEEKKSAHEVTDISAQEEKILEYLREVHYGELRIVVNAGKPVRVEEIKKSFVL